MIIYLSYEVTVQAMANHVLRRSFIGYSDVRIIMGEDEAALLRLGQEKRGEIDRGPVRQPHRPPRLKCFLGETRWIS